MRTLTWLLCLLLLLPSALSAGTVAIQDRSTASPTLSREAFIAEMLPLLRYKADVGPEYTELTLNTYDDGLGGQQYDITWRTPSIDYGYDQKQIRICCDSLGNITTYERGSQMYDASLAVNELSEIERSAYALLCRLFPEKRAEIANEAMPEYGDFWGAFFFPRLVNGLPVRNQGFSVSFDQAAGEISQVYSFWDEEISFPAATVPAAPVDFSLSLDLKLSYALFPRYMDSLSQYQHIGTHSELGQPCLVYRSAYSDSSLDIDAERMQRLSPNLNYGYLQNYELTSLFHNHEYLDLSRLQELPQTLSAEEALAMLRSMPELFLPDDAELTDHYYVKSYAPNQDGRYLILLNLQAPQSADSTYDGADYSVSASVDIVSGELCEYSYYSNMMSEEKTYAPLDSQELITKAEAFLHSYWPQQLASARLDEHRQGSILGQIGTASSCIDPLALTWIRQANGLDFDDNYLRVFVDARSGKITSFDRLWLPDLHFPKAEAQLSEAEAAQIMLDALPLRLEYRYLPEREGMAAVYSSPITAYALRADDGLLLDHLGRRYTAANQPIFPDLIDAPERKLVERAFRRQLITSESRAFKPQEKMNQERFVLSLAHLAEQSYLLTSLSSSYDYLVSIDALSRDKIDRQAEVNGGEALRMLLIVSGYADLAAEANLFVEIPGVPAALQSYVAIGRGLGIIDSDYPLDRSLSNLEATVLLAKAAIRPLR